MIGLRFALAGFVVTACYGPRTSPTEAENGSTCRVISCLPTPSSACLPGSASPT